MLRHAGSPALSGGRKQPSLRWQRMPAFMAALDRMPGLAPLALRFAILTTLRSGEVRGARWSEIRFEGGAMWTVPGERMTGKKAADVLTLRVPLSAAAVQVLMLAYQGQQHDRGGVDRAGIPKLTSPSPGACGSMIVTCAPSRWSRQASARPTMPARIRRTLRTGPCPPLLVTRGAVDRAPLRQRDAVGVI